METASERETSMRIITTNLNGFRSATSKGFLNWMDAQQADFVCVQELRIDAEPAIADMFMPVRCQGYFNFAARKGYSGVGIYTRHPPDQIIKDWDPHRVDTEGRYIELRIGDLSVISVYVPSGSSGAARQAVKFDFMERIFPHLSKLAMSNRAVVLCGDWNIAHKEIDLTNWKSNQRSSGFLPEERAWLTRLFDELGWVDIYRQLHPKATDECYTWWSSRGHSWTKNVGWRLDYQISTPNIARTAHSAAVYKANRFSDHAPLIVDYAWPL